MNEPELDLRHAIQALRKRWAILCIAVAIGALIGAAYTVLSPPMLASSALVALPPGTKDIQSQALVAQSANVLAPALRATVPSASPQVFAGYVEVKGATGNILAVTGHGRTAARAEGIANAVAVSYIAYVTSGHSAVGTIPARLLERATYATGASVTSRSITAGTIGAFAACIIAAIFVVAMSRRDRRLRRRDEIADAVAVPVLASFAVGAPRSAADWATLADAAEYSRATAWRFEYVLNHLGFLVAESFRIHEPWNSLAIVSFSDDQAALALPPRLAAFTASGGIPTQLVVRADEGSRSALALQAAAAGWIASSKRPALLEVSIADHGSRDGRHRSDLEIVMFVVDRRTPRISDVIGADATVLAVSAGAASAEELIEIAEGATRVGQRIDGVFVTAAESSDPTTGRISPRIGASHRPQPTRLAASAIGARR